MLRYSQDIYTEKALMWPHDSTTRSRGPVSREPTHTVAARERSRGEAVSVTVLYPGTDLRRVFVDCVDRYRNQDWIIENKPTYPCVFVHKGEERHMSCECQREWGKFLIHVVLVLLR
jgi:hypothetical protein